MGRLKREVRVELDGVAKRRERDLVDGGWGVGVSREFVDWRVVAAGRLSSELARASRPLPRVSIRH